MDIENMNLKELHEHTKAIEATQQQAQRTQTEINSRRERIYSQLRRTLSVGQNKKRSSGNST